MGIYSAASNTAMSILAFSSIFGASFIPVIAQLYHSDKKEELEKIYNCVTLWGMCITFILCLTLIIFNKEIISFFGRGLNAAEPVLVVLSISFLVEAASGQVRQLFEMSSHQNIELINSFAAIIVNVALNLIFIPSLGVMGAAFAFLSTMIIMSVARAIELKIIFGFLPFNRRYLKIIIFIIFAIVVSLLPVVNTNIIVRIATAIFIFSSFARLIFKSRSEEDMIVWNEMKISLSKKQGAGEMLCP